MEDSIIAAFSIPKIGDVGCCSSAASSWIMNWMVPRESAHRIGLVCQPLGLANCSSGILLWDILVVTANRLAGIRIINKKPSRRVKD